MDIVQLPPTDLVPYEQNPRHNEAAVEAVARSITEFGFRSPIVVDPDHVVIAEHTRLKAALKLGIKTVPVHIATELTPEQVRAYRIADNKTAEIAEWDLDLLPIELAELQQLDVDLDLLGFDETELAKLLDPGITEGLTDPDEVPEPPEEAITQPGDLWRLGEHRLLCGDSTSVHDITRLMNGETARMCFTDPPWNVAIGTDRNPRHRQREGLVNDDLSDDDFQAFLSGFITAMRPVLTGDLYCVLGASEWPTLDRCLRDAGYHWSATIIWVKQQFVLGRSKYHRRYEPIWYGWHADDGSSFGERRDQDDVWEIDRPTRSPEHPTMKPVELVVRAIQNSSLTGDVVLDPFLGSGTTLLAAERTGRRCYGLELSPNYCDVIIRRWEEFTGETAERVPTETEVRS